MAETWQFEIEAGDYIYIAAWGDDAVAQGLIGQFDFGFGSLLLTNQVNWLYHQTQTPLGDRNAPPSTGDTNQGDLGYEINGSWEAVNYSMDHGSDPWGTITGISSEADWIWGSQMTPAEDSSAGYQIFRTKQPIAPVPEPATIFLVGSGLMALGGISRKRRNKKKDLG